MCHIRAECRTYFDHADISAENIACSLSIESMKRCAGDGRTIIIICINTASIEVLVYVGLAQACPNHSHVLQMCSEISSRSRVHLGNKQFLCMVS